MSAIVYRGYGNDNPAGGRLVTVIRDGVESPLRHVVRHSPTGYTWGYAGSGPADLALSLLVDALGDTARCPECGGATKVMTRYTGGGDLKSAPYSEQRIKDQPFYDWQVESCWDCDDGIRRGLPYQEFKFQVVAGLPESWTLTQDEILRWHDAWRKR